MDINTVKNKTETSRKHFFVEGERIKIEDKNAIYEIREPKDLAMQVDFGYARYDIILRLVDKYCQGEGLAHLDLGCGLGYVMAKMSQREFKTSGIDISRSFLEIAAEKLKHCNLRYEKLMEADIQKNIGLPDNYFDLITSTDVLEHIENPEPFFIQIQRLLKKGGKAVICTNNYLSIWGLEKIIRENFFLQKCFHPIDRWWTNYSLRKMLKKYNFRILEMRGTYFMPLARLKRLFLLTGIYPRRYEINDRLSSSLFKYFGRDMIFVIEKI